MIDFEQINAAADSGMVGPEHDEVLQVDTDAVAKVAKMVMGEWMDQIVATMLLTGTPLASHAAAWSHGFMSGVKAARDDERGHRG